MFYGVQSEYKYLLLSQLVTEDPLTARKQHFYIILKTLQDKFRCLTWSAVIFGLTDVNHVYEVESSAAFKNRNLKENSFFLINYR